MNHMDIIKRVVVVVLLVVAVIILHTLAADGHFSLAGLQAKVHIFVNFVNEHYAASVLVYISSFIIGTMLFLPITVLFTLLGGFLFGVLFGTFYALLGIVVGSVCTFFMMRYVLRAFIQKRFAVQLQRFNHEIAEHGPRYLLTLQLLPATPTWVINAFAGLTHVSWQTFVWTTAVGMLPQTVMYAWLGKEFHTIESLKDLYSWWPVLIILSVLALLVSWPLIKKSLK